MMVYCRQKKRKNRMHSLENLIVCSAVGEEHRDCVMKTLENLEHQGFLERKEN